MNIGEYLKDLRKSKSLTLSKLATLSGVSQPFLSQIENGSRNPSPEVLNKIAPALEVPSLLLLKKAGMLDLESVNLLDIENEDVQKRDIPITYLNEWAELFEKIRSIKEQIYKATEEENLDKVSELQKKHEEYENKLAEFFTLIKLRDIPDEDREDGRYHLFDSKRHKQPNKTNEIWLDDNNEGDFTFIKNGKELPVDKQYKIKTMIKWFLE